MNHFLATGLLTLSLYFSILHPSKSQSYYGMRPEWNHNTVNGSIGSGGLYFTATGYYERILKKQDLENLNQFAKVGYGAAAFWSGSHQYVLLHYGFLTGQKKHHAEASVGGVYYLTDQTRGFIGVSGSAGYRYQKPKGWFIFRIGAGWPEAGFIGTGFAF